MKLRDFPLPGRAKWRGSIPWHKRIRRVTVRSDDEGPGNVVWLESDDAEFFAFRMPEHVVLVTREWEL